MSNLIAISFSRAIFVQMICCILFASNFLTVIAVQGNRQDKDWTEIERLYERGWLKLANRNLGDSESSFRKASLKLERYRSYYIKDQNSLSFLRAIYMLGNFNELGNRDNEAQQYYKQALMHPLADSIDATAEAKLIVQYSRKRLSIVEQRLRNPSTSLSKDYPRISIKGGSKGGDRDLPRRETLFRP